MSSDRATSPPLPPYLADDELRDICAPLTQPAAMVRALEGMGLIVKTKPNGRPMVGRAHFEQVMNGGVPVPQDRRGREQEPNLQALKEYFETRRRR